MSDNVPAPIERLSRWQEFGGVWQVVARSGDIVTVSLCRCDGGEEVDRLTSADPGLLRWLADLAVGTLVGPAR